MNLKAIGGKRLLGVGLVILCAFGFLLYRGLDDATLYFRTADEAVQQRQTLGEKRFRIEGTVVPGSLKKDGTYTDFAIASKGATVEVDNKAATQGIFREDIPVVLEGKFVKGSNTFMSDRIMVKHDSNYTEQHQERVNG